MTERSRFAEYRDRQRGGPPRTLQPCGTVAAARRHQRAGEELCAPCAEVWREHQREMQAAYRARRKAAAGKGKKKA